MRASTTLFRARVPTARLKSAERVLARLGLKPGEAFNMLLAQVELRDGLPFPVTTKPDRILTADEQAAIWTDSLDAY